MENQLVKALIQKGVQIRNPESVDIHDDVNIDRISGENVVIYGGCKIAGKDTLILKNSKIGYEAPVTLENTIVGENCRLNGGFFRQAAFSGNNEFGSGAHVREGTIFEEEASAAHTVGLKQTILFPFVTLGSLINFCDCFMAGGTSRKNHSEVGSSFIHFNYTPNQDKATASMMGDVINGVMLQSSPIFLGGQGGLVGPVKIAYGCLSAAGSIIRRSEAEQDRILLGGALKDMSMPRQPMVYKNVSDTFNRNIDYIAELSALRAWYHYIRPMFMSSELASGLQQILDLCITERIKRFKQFGEKLELSKQILLDRHPKKPTPLIQIHDLAIQKLPEVLERFDAKGKSPDLSSEGETFASQVSRKRIFASPEGYINTIQGLRDEEQRLGSTWLKSIKHDVSNNLYLKLGSK